MKIVFVTAHPLISSTSIGRVIPLAKRFAENHDVTILAHSSDAPAVADNVRVEIIGKDPFTRTESGKKYKRGIGLVWQMLVNTWNTLLLLVHIQPDVAVIIKPLPQNVAATFLWHLFNAKKRVILDVDDFELTANKLTSIYQRMAIHWSERAGATMADAIVAATPFLMDHFEQLTAGRKKPVHIPTALPVTVSLAPYPADSHKMIYIGSISHHSGHKTDMLPHILRVVRSTFPDATLDMAGSGDNVQELKAAFEKEGVADAVTWTGRFDVQNSTDLLTNTALILDPIDASIVNRAKSSFRVALAAEAGLPVVTSDVGIRPMLLPVSVHDAFFAKPADADDYAETAVRLLSNPIGEDSRTAMREHAQQYTWDALISTYTKLLDGSAG